MIEAGWQPHFAARVHPWLRAGYSYGSGDGHAGDGTHGTFIQPLPTARLQAHTPFYNMSNLVDRYAILKLQPAKKLTLDIEGHALRLANAADLWYAGGGAFQPWTFGFQGRPSNGALSLANTAEIQADYALNSHWIFTGYGGAIWGKRIIESIYGRSRHGGLLYGEFTYKF